MTHSFPSRRASDLRDRGTGASALQHARAGGRGTARGETRREGDHGQAGHVSAARAAGIERTAADAGRGGNHPAQRRPRSEEHTSELQSLMRISYDVFCLKKKKTHQENNGNSTRQTKIA